MTVQNSFVFSRFAEKKFLHLDKKIRDRIRIKLQELKPHGRPEAVLKQLTDLEPATHRLRVGHYRVILQKLSEHEFLVLDIGHRSAIYR